MKRLINSSVMRLEFWLNIWLKNWLEILLEILLERKAVLVY